MTRLSKSEWLTLDDDIIRILRYRLRDWTDIGLEKEKQLMIIEMSRGGIDRCMNCLACIRRGENMPCVKWAGLKEDDEIAFLRKIQENPKDDIVKLVYADYLIDQGDNKNDDYYRERGEFIKIQIELDRLMKEGPPKEDKWVWRYQVDKLEKRMLVIWRKYKERFVKGIPGVVHKIYARETKVSMKGHATYIFVKGFAIRQGNGFLS